MSFVCLAWNASVKLFKAFLGVLLLLKILFFLDFGRLLESGFGLWG
jgi:hypothetical protein